MLTLSNLGVAWGAVTALLVMLLIYRAVITMSEDDQVFLEEPESRPHREQAASLARINRIRPWISALTTISGLLASIIGVLFLYHGIVGPAH